MHCRAYCTVTSYKIKPLYDQLKQAGATATFYRDAVHLSLSSNTDTIRDVFYYAYGAAVFWGVSHEECLVYLQHMKPFEEQPLERVEADEFTFVIGDATKIIEDEIVLPDRGVLSRLAISHGLAQSVKLGTFESALRKTFDDTKHIPQDLAKYGRISLSRREIRRKMGELFIERSSIHLHIDLLDTPDFFWEYAELEPLYAIAANYLDLKTRGEALNQRLDVIHELFEMLGNELNHQHSNRLEWTIIGLIVVEVCVSLLRDVFRLI